MPAYATRTIDHVETPRRFRQLSSDSLRYIVGDCRAAIDAMPDGGNVGSYLDEINYAANELHRRKARQSCPTCGHAR
jgi:hypothetical protein